VFDWCGAVDRQSYLVRMRLVLMEQYTEEGYLYATSLCSLCSRTFKHSLSVQFWSEPQHVLGGWARTGGRGQGPFLSRNRSPNPNVAVLSRLFWMWRDGELTASALEVRSDRIQASSALQATLTLAIIFFLHRTILSPATPSLIILPDCDRHDLASPYPYLDLS
jgi:hypothetical protein